MTNPADDDRELQRLLRGALPPAPFDDQHNWKRLQARRRAAERVWKAVGVVTAIAAGIVMTFSLTSRDGSTPAIASSSTHEMREADSLAESLEQAIRPRLGALESATRATLITDLAIIDTAVVELRTFRTTSTLQDSTRAAQVERLMRRRVRLLRDVADELGVGAS